MLRNSLIQSSNVLGRNNKSAILIPMQPNPPKPQANPPPPPPNQLTINQNWQIEWMNHYAQSREEAAKLKEENAGLREKIEKQNYLLA